MGSSLEIGFIKTSLRLRTKFDIAGAATDGFFSRNWVYKNIFKIADEDIDRIQIELYGDAKLGAALEEAGTLPEGGEGGDLGGDLGLGDDDGSGGLDLGDDGDTDEPEGPLLAEPEPAQRDDKRKTSGPRLRSMNGQWNKESSSKTKRTLYKGDDLVQGLTQMTRLKNGIATENLDKNEKLIFSTQFEIGKLIEQLGNKDEGQA